MVTKYQLIFVDNWSIDISNYMKCLVAFKNRYCSMQRAHASQNSHSIEESILQARVFSEFISHIEGEVEYDIYTLKFNELLSHYENGLKKLGVVKAINKSRALPFFMPLITSQFNGKTKKSMWEAWKLYSPATQVFAQIVCQPFQPLTKDSQGFLSWRDSLVFFTIRPLDLAW